MITYVDAGDALEFTVSLDEAWPFTAKDLVDSSPGQFHGLAHDLLIFGARCRTWTVIVCVTAFKLAHLLKSIIVSTSSRLVILCIWALISVVSRSDWSRPISTVILAGHLQSVGSCLGHPSWIRLRRWLLSSHSSIPGHVHCLDAVVKPRVKHLPRLFRAMAPGLMLVHVSLLSRSSRLFHS